MKRLGFNLIILGDPTSGKDTQAGRLMKRYSLHPVESGKYWRALLKKGGKNAARLKKTMALGYPTPVDMMKIFLLASLAKRPKGKDLIFIGNPRLKPEAQLLVKLLKKSHEDFFVIYIKIPVPEILKRTQLRSRLRSEELGVRNRIRYHEQQVSKTVKYFKQLGKLRFISGKPPIPKVAKDIQKAINDYQKSRGN